ncbi:MAG: HTH domain-containing protein [Blastocatellia bacterium]
MNDDPTISAYQNSLQQYRDARDKCLLKIRKLEEDLAQQRAQEVRLARLIDEAKDALSQALLGEEPVMRRAPMLPQIDMEISAPPRQSPPQYQQHYQPPYQPQREERYAPPQYQPPHQPQYREPQDPSLQYQTAQIEEQVAKARRSERNSNVRFNDFRIPQAATIVLREAGHPLHVNEIYNRMAEGGFEFRGQHQLITLAVSLSRSKRFRKVSPGTFELSPEFLAGQVA